MVYGIMTANFIYGSICTFSVHFFYFMWCVVWDSCFSLKVNCNCDMSSDICNLINNCYSKNLNLELIHLLISPHSFLYHTPNLNICLQILKQKSLYVSYHWDSANNEDVFGSKPPCTAFHHDKICRQENFVCSCLSFKLIWNAQGYIYCFWIYNTLIFYVTSCLWNPIKAKWDKNTWKMLS